MDDNDVVTLQVVDRVRAITEREARRVLLAVAIGALVAAALVVLLAYALYGPLSTTVALTVGSVFLLFGALQFVHWARHYQSIRRQLDALSKRVSRGELVYGAQVKFHSYRQRSN